MVKTSVFFFQIFLCRSVFSFLFQSSHVSSQWRFALNGSKEPITSSYADTDNVGSQSLVSILTGLVNTFFSKDSNLSVVESSSSPPKTASELLQRLSVEYTDKNYLWTGDIDLACFESRCCFTDPTLSFTGTDQFVKNIRNLRPIVDVLILPGDCKSDLLDIQLNEREGYVQSRWNMVGTLSRLPWKPKIDVIGQTKFWYNSENKVYFYDEVWEIPATRALLQLVTPAGTIENTSRKNEV